MYLLLGDVHILPEVDKIISWENWATPDSVDDFTILGKCLNFCTHRYHQGDEVKRNEFAFYRLICFLLIVLAITEFETYPREQLMSTFWSNYVVIKRRTITT